MIVFAGSLHRQLVHSLLGKWHENGHQLTFALDKAINSQSLTMSFMGQSVTGCKLEFDEAGIVLLVDRLGDKIPISGIINLDDTIELRLVIENQERRFVKVPD